MNQFSCLLLASLLFGLSSGNAEVTPREISDNNTLIEEVVKDYFLDTIEDRVPIGTKLYWYSDSDHNWFEGEIIDYTDNEGYSILWEDDTTTEVDFQQEDEVKQMANYYQHREDIEEESEPIPSGTRIFHYFEDEEEWYEGNITSWSPTTGYIVMWEDRSVEVNSYDQEQILQMVLNYMNVDLIDQESNRPLPVGTRLIWYSEDDANMSMEGKIVKWSPMDGYFIKWVDESVEVGVYSDDEMDQMALNYINLHGDDLATENKDTFPIGTQLYLMLDGQTFEGSISDYDSEIGYTISWNNGDVEVNEYSDLEIQEMIENWYELQEMVSDNVEYQDQNELSKKTGGIGACFRSFFVVSMILSFTLVVFQRHRKRKQQATLENLDYYDGFRFAVDNAEYY